MSCCGMSVCVCVYVHVCVCLCVCMCLCVCVCVGWRVGVFGILYIYTTLTWLMCHALYHDKY